MGTNPSTGKDIFLKIGRYGRYLEMQTENDKPKRVSIPKNISNDDINLEKSLKFIQLPRVIGIFPETKEEILASIGPYGPYLKHDKKFISLKEDDVTEIGINRAIELIQKNIDENKENLIGIHPESKKKIIQKKGIKGRPDYISYNKKNYSISKEMNEKKITLEIALELIGKGKKSAKN